MMRFYLAIGAALAAALILVVAGVFIAVPSRAAAASPAWRCVVASWYGTESGNRTATGERFDGTGLTAAMPGRGHLGERYRVHFGHSSVVVRINDVGPAAWTHRGIDLSRSAALRIGLIGRGVGTVCLERLG